MIIWFEAGQDTSFRVVLKTISCPQTPYCKNPPGILSPHENPHFWRVFCDFKTFLIPFCNLKRYIQSCHRKVQNLLYKTLFSDFLYPSWLLKYLAFSFKIRQGQVFKYLPSLMQFMKTSIHDKDTYL